MALALLSPGAARAAPPRGVPVVFDRIVAVVDGEPILLSTLRRRAAPFVHPSKGVPGYRRQQQLRQTYRMLMKRLIDERLVDSAARDAGISVDKADVDAAIARVAAQNHMKKRELQAAVRGAGMTGKEYRDEIRRQIVEYRLLYAFMRRVGVKVHGKDKKERERSVERERKRWMAKLRSHASIEQYFDP